MVLFFIVGKGLVPFLMFVGCFRLEERDKPFPYGFYVFRLVSSYVLFPRIEEENIPPTRVEGFFFDYPTPRELLGALCTQNHKKIEVVHRDVHRVSTR